MPPKKTNSGASKKAEVKKKEKIIEVSWIQCFLLHFFVYSVYVTNLMDFIFMQFFIFVLNNIQDKTFGLKNKKGAKTQKFIQQVEKQVKSGGQHPLNSGLKKDEKEKKLQEQKELQALFR